MIWQKGKKKEEEEKNHKKNETGREKKLRKIVALMIQALLLKINLKVRVL
jgi:ribosomal protein S8E